MAAKPRSRSAIRSETSSSPIWKRSVGPPGSHFVAVRYSAQSNQITRLSYPPHEKPMPNNVSASRKALTARCGTGLRTMLNSPDAPENSMTGIGLERRMQHAQHLGTFLQPAGDLQSGLIVAREPNPHGAQAAQREVHVVGPD